MVADPTQREIDALVRESRTLRDDAERLLQESRAIELWQQYGDVEVAGSYRWQLMLDGDVDLYVINPRLTLDLALAALTEMVHRGDFLCFGFIDSVRGTPGWADPRSYPQGYYVGMSKEFHGRQWKVEAWLLPAPPPRPEWIGERLTAASQRTILSLKHLRNTRAFAVSSYDIYRAVLLGGAQTVADVQAWLRANPATANQARPGG